MQSLTLTFLTHKFGTKDWLDQAKVFTSLSDVSGTISRAAILEALRLYNVGDSTDFSQIDYTSWLYLTTQTGWTENEVRDAFNYFDYGNDGIISGEDLRRRFTDW